MRTRQILTAVLMMSGVAAFAPIASAHDGSTCSARLGTITPVPALPYDPFDGISRNVSFAVEVINNGSDDCRVALAIASQNSNTQRVFKMGTQKLRYSVETQGGSDYPNSLTQPFGSTTLPGGQGRRKTIVVVVKVQAGVIAPAGTYGDVLSLQLFRTGDGRGSALGSARTVNANAAVEARAQINIAGASGVSSSSSFAVDRLDFGTLSNGEQKSAFVQVRTTREITFTIRSQNLGKLKHQVLSGDPGIAYTMKLAGATVDLSAAATLHRAPAVSLDGTSYPLSVRIGDIAGRPAGNYQDLLTITVSP